jgi:hypothetical protein
MGSHQESATKFQRTRTTGKQARARPIPAPKCPLQHRATQKIESFLWNLNKKLHSITMHQHPVSQQQQKRLPETSPNPFQNHVSFQNHGVYYRTNPVKPAENKRRQPATTAYYSNSPCVCATIPSWQNENTIQSQNSLPQSPKAIETSPQSFTEMA